MRRGLAWGWLVASAWLGTARAELVYFAKGGQAQVEARVEGTTVRLRTPAGPKTFDRGDFLAIVPGHDPAAEWPRRREVALRDGSASVLFEAFWWALENGLTEEAVALLRAGRPVVGGHAPARRALAMIDALDAPCPDADLEPVRRLLGRSRFAEIRGAHVVLLHQGDDAEARERLEVLDRVASTFCLVLAAQGIEQPPPGRRLVSVYFARQGDYVAFLRRAEADAFATTQGYFHPNLGAVFAFDTRDGEGQAAPRRALARRKAAGLDGSEVDRQALLLDLDWRAVDLGIAAHETIHQLTATSGLAPSFDAFPLWLHEGFAAQFEVVRGGRWAGVGRAHDFRLADWRSIRPAPRLAPLLRDSGFGHGYGRDVYAESWALVHFLRKTRPREFLTFLDLLRAPRPDNIAPNDRSVEAFHAAFGDDLAGLESAWRRHVATLETPLESARPINPDPSRETHLARPDPGP